MKRRTLIIISAVVALAVIALLLFQLIFPPSNPQVTGNPPTSAINSIDARRTNTAQAALTLTPRSSGALVNTDGTQGIQLVSFVPAPDGNSAPQQTQQLYTSCTELRVRQPGGRPTPTATAAATAAPTAAATKAVGGSPANLVRYEIAGSESEVCFLVPELFVDNEFRIAVGVTRSIVGEIEIDKGNVANSLIGDIRVNVNELRSDESRRDGMIQREFLQSNRYPFAVFDNVEVLGLPVRSYQEGEMLKFQVTGMLYSADKDAKIRPNAKPRPTTFDVTAKLDGETLFVTAVTSLTMSELGVQAPNVIGLVKADDHFQIVLNLVARPKK